MLPQTPVARADAQFSVAVLLPPSADCHSSHPCVDASGESRGTRRARPLLVLPAVDDRPGNRYRRDLIETHSDVAVRLGGMASAQARCPLDADSSGVEA